MEISMIRLVWPRTSKILEYHAANKVIENSSAISYLRDYAIASGIDIPDELLKEIKDLDAVSLYAENSEAKSLKVILALNRLIALTYPITIYNMPIVGRSSLDRFRLALLSIGIIAFFACLTSMPMGIYFQTFRIGIGECTSTCSAVFSVTVLVYGASLGLLGATIYELFHIAGILQ
jgi:hypothetical protein